MPLNDSSTVDEIVNIAMQIEAFPVCMKVCTIMTLKPSAALRPGRWQNGHHPSGTGLSLARREAKSSICRLSQSETGL